MLKEISIEIIRKCPNNCLHCSSMSNEYCTEIMDYDLIVSLVDDAVLLGADTICLSGGEPFLHPDILEIIEYICKNGINCHVYTSGIVMDSEGRYVPIEVKDLSQLIGKTTKLIFNIEAATASTYDEVMGTRGCFEIMKCSVVNASKSGLTVEAHFVPMRLNIDEVERVIRLCESLGISQISFLRLVLHGRAVQNKDVIALTDAETAFLKKRLENIRANGKIHLRIGVPLALDENCHKCEAANGKLNIKYDGCVFPCEVFKNDRNLMLANGYAPESIHKKTLREIYVDSEYLKYIRGLSKQFFSKKKTETCVGQYLISRGGAVDELE